MQVKHLAAAPDLVADGIDHDFFVVGFDDGLDRMAVGRRGLDHAQVARARERHVERARDRRGAHREHVHGGAHRLEDLLVLHAEALLFVDHDEPELLEFHIALQQPMGADEDIDLAGGGGREDAFLLRFGAEAADHFDGDRVTGHALAKCVEMLLREHGRRHEHRDLAAALHGLERGADRDLGFAEADVAADEAVHWAWLFMIGLRFLDGAKLVARFGVGERGLKFLLPSGVGWKAWPGCASRMAWMRNNSAARSMVARSAAWRAFSQRPEPMRPSCGRVLLRPT